MEHHGSFFEAPWVPVIPCVGIFINWYLIAQLEWTGLLLLVAYLGITAILYFTCCSTNDMATNWKQGGPYHGVNLSDDDNDIDDGIML